MKKITSFQVIVLALSIYAIIALYIGPAQKSESDDIEVLKRQLEEINRKLDLLSELSVYLLCS